MAAQWSRGSWRDRNKGSKNQKENDRKRGEKERKMTERGKEKREGERRDILPFLATHHNWAALAL